MSDILIYLVVGLIGCGMIAAIQEGVLFLKNRRRQ